MKMIWTVGELKQAICEFDEIIDDVVEKLKKPGDYPLTHEVAFSLVENDDRFFLIETVASSNNHDIR